MKRLSSLALLVFLLVALPSLTQAALPAFLPFRLTDSHAGQLLARASAAPTIYLPWTANDEWYVSQDWGTDCCPACSHCNSLLYAWDFQKLPANTQAEGQPVLAVAQAALLLW